MRLRAACVSGSGKIVDDAVGPQLFQAITPQAIEGASAAAQQAGAPHREQRQPWVLGARSLTAQLGPPQPVDARTLQAFAQKLPALWNDAAPEA
jgi:hypothetical protein